jgi:hypothetical protein
MRFRRDGLFALTSTPEREWWATVFEDRAQTVAQIQAVLDMSEAHPSGCRTIGTARPKRVKMHGRQIYAYQLIYWAGNALLPAEGDVVRHMCHNRLCINPTHLVHGTQRENIQDTRER